MGLSRILLCAALVSGVVVAGGGTASAECEQIWLKVYDVEVDAERKTYRVGETARVEAMVTRKDGGAPVQDAPFGLIVTNWRKGWLFGFDETDAQGRADMALELRRNRVKLGPVNVVALAYKEIADVASCVQIGEYGKKRARKLFTIEP